jgi:hypothetical protein
MAGEVLNEIGPQARKTSALGVLEALVLKSLEDPQCKHEILERIGKLRSDSPRRWGKMTAPQMVCHLNDAFLGVMGRKPISVAPNMRARKLVKWIAIYAPVRWPKGVPTRPEFDAQIGGTPPSEFELDKQKLLGLVEEFTRQPRGFEFRPHPIFLEMTEREWMRWGYLHTDHHLRQFSQ